MHCQTGVSQILSDTLMVNHLGQDKGLVQLNANALTQDENGFLWVGTEDGLHRFNGYEFKLFTASPNDSNSIQDDHIRGLYAKGDTLWIASNTKGILGYQLSKNKFFALKKNNKNLNLGISYGIFPLNEDFLLFSFKNYATVYNTKTKREVIVKLPTNSRESRVLDVDAINETEYIFTTSASGPLVFNIKTGIVKPFKIEGLELITQIEALADGFLIGTITGIYTVDKQFKSLKKYVDGVSVNHISKKSEGTFFIATQVKLLEFNVGDGVTSYIVKDTSKKIYKPFTANEIVSDENGNTWFGTEGDGVVHYNSFQKKFETNRVRLNDVLKSTNINIFPFYKDTDSILWLGSSFGVVKHNTYKNTYKLYKHKNANIIYAFAKDENNTLWAGGIFDGLLKYIPSEDRFKQYLKHPYKENTLPDNEVLEIIPMPGNKLWLCTWTGGISEFNTETETFTPILINGKRINRARISLKDSKGNLWLGTDEGLYKLNSSLEFEHHFTETAAKEKSLTSNRIFAINEDNNGFIWIGTSSGITKLNTSTLQTEKFIKQKGFPNDFVYSLLIDEANNVWVSTNKGISVLNSKTKEFKNYTSEDGLQNNEFNGKSGYKDKDGYFYFGGIDGFNKFQPSQIKDYPYQPKVYFESVELFNTPIESTLRNNDTLYFKSDENVITLNYSSLSYLNPEKTYYRYKLKDFNESWSPSTQRQNATYTNLNPGEYTFYVSASQMTGQWSDPKVLNIVVKPLWYQTIVFKILLVLCIFAMGVYIVSRETNALKRDKEKLSRLVDQRTQDLLLKNKALEKANKKTSQQKDNISFLMKELNHRVKNNLQIISSLLNIQSATVDSQAKDSLLIAKNRILAIAYIQNEIQIDQKKINVKKFIEEFVPRILQLLADDGLMKFEIIYNLKRTGFCEVNTTLLGLILNELVTNTFKYAFKTYNKDNYLKISCEKINHTLLITLEDNGCGYTLDEIKSSSLGVGLVSDMVSQLDGALETNTDNGVVNSIKIDCK